MILHSNRNVFSLSLASFAFLLCFSAFVNARVKHVYKLMLMDYRGNTKIDYTTSDPSTYIAYNGGSALIKGFRVLEHWSSFRRVFGKSIIIIATMEIELPYSNPWWKCVARGGGGGEAWVGGRQASCVTFRTRCPVDHRPRRGSRGGRPGVREARAGSGR